MKTINWSNSWSKQGMHVNRKCASNVQLICEYRKNIEDFQQIWQMWIERHKTIYTLIKIEYGTVVLCKNKERKHHILVRKLHFQAEIRGNFIHKRLPIDYQRIAFYQCKD